jgi:hypothetical protein
MLIDGSYGVGFLNRCVCELAPRYGASAVKRLIQSAPNAQQYGAAARIE